MLGAGLTTFGCENPGEVRHERIMVLLRPEVTAQHIQEALQGRIILRKLREQFGDGEILGILLASPHQSSGGLQAGKERSDSSLNVLENQRFLRHTLPLFL